jgi:hypothetical protein
MRSPDPIEDPIPPVCEMHPEHSAPCPKCRASDRVLAIVLAGFGVSMVVATLVGVWLLQHRPPLTHDVHAYGDTVRSVR